ncbi:hypothetical protein BDQ17DRAFT_386930 [Cyathus striatus]|nr:hypothetical protein BDQ17DRAFT_386930 [Cyathus striatus]
MGVSGLWDVLRPAAKTRSLTELAVVEGFQKNRDGLRGFRIGIDASIWFFHAEYGREGENPVLRTLFFRCASLMRSPFLPLFVFDGPKRPDVKRGKKINKTSHKLIPGMKQIVEAFGFEWRTAPGEAEAELAYLNSIGVIDGILSDDVDNFLFGALTVIRNSSNNLSGNRANPTLNSAGKDDKNHTRVYCLSDITDHPDIKLSRGGLILIGLMSGGDYEQGGLTRCGIVTSHGLAKCGFGDTLYQAAATLEREELHQFLVGWRKDLVEELRTNSQGCIGRKQTALANSILDSFPNIDVLLSYVNPITSATMGRDINTVKPTWSKEPDIAKLAAVCEFYFEWGYKEAILKRFRTVIWHSAVLRVLRRAAINFDESGLAKSTSQLVSQYFCSSVPDGDLQWNSEEGSNEPMIVKIHSSRNHSSTDGLLEYRLEIAPLQLARIAATGIKGIRIPEGSDEWASESDGDEDGEKKTKAPLEPNTHMRIWAPACMVELAETQLVKDFQEQSSRKRSTKNRLGDTRAKSIKIGNVHLNHVSTTLEPATRMRNGTTISDFQSSSSSTMDILNVKVSDGSGSFVTSKISKSKGKSIVRDLTKRNTKLKESGPGIKNHFQAAKRSTPLSTNSITCRSEETEPIPSTSYVNKKLSACTVLESGDRSRGRSELNLAPFPLSTDLQAGTETMQANTGTKIGLKPQSKTLANTTLLNNRPVVRQSSQSPTPRETIRLKILSRSRAIAIMMI